jgi:putative aminopeptidase FrvX
VQRSMVVQVTDGDGHVLVTAVGGRSEWGLIMEKVTVEEQAETPLQQKLGTLLSSCHGLERTPTACLRPHLARAPC